MATDTDTNTVEQTEDVSIPDVTLEEFCVRKSMVDRRVELLGGFHYVEKQAGRFKDAESNYEARFEAYANQPV